MQETYMDILIQSLRKKLEILKEISEADEKQKMVLENVEGSVEEFDETVERKSTLIDQLEHLDNGFEKLYEHVKEELETGKEQYAAQIKDMQGYIRQITGLSMEVQAQEARNKELMTQKFAKAKEQGRSVRANSRAVTQYYQNMTGTGFVDPQFWDGKQ